MMLEWLGERHGVSACAVAADHLNEAIHGLFAEAQVLPAEFGGGDGTAEIAAKVLDRLNGA